MSGQFVRSWNTPLCGTDEASVEQHELLSMAARFACDGLNLGADVAGKGLGCHGALPQCQRHTLSYGEFCGEVWDVGKV